MISKYTIKLALDAEVALPTEFRLFVKGWNETENGRFLFDDASAKSVMAAYKTWGVDLMIDLNHQSLEASPGAADPTACDARGWCKLELRSDGSLWAVEVKWTPDGAARLANKTQRYVSPAFETEEGGDRILKMINVAIVAMPATHNTPALVAASRNNRRNAMNVKKLHALAKRLLAAGMDPDLIKSALEAIEEGNAEKATEILKGMIVSAASGEDPSDEPGSEDDGAEGTAPPATEAVEDPKVVDAAVDTDGEDDDEDPKKKTERKAMRKMLYALTGKKTFAEAVAQVEDFRTSHLTLETERRQLAAQRATLESAERRKLVVELVTLGAEFPATVWADDKATAMKPRWLKMPIAELRAHVADQRGARGTKKLATKTGATAPANDENEDGLTPAELKICADTKCDPKDFVRLKAIRNQDGSAHLLAARDRVRNAHEQIAAASGKKG